LEDRRISAKSITEQLTWAGWVHHSWRFGHAEAPRSGSPNPWTWIKNVNGASRLSKFRNFFNLIQMISCRDWWPWTKPSYITMTRRQSNSQWNGVKATHPAPKNSECKNPLANFSPRFFGIKSVSSSLSSKGPNYQRGVLLISASEIEWDFEGKTPREGHQAGLVFARQCPGSPDTCNPEETGLPGLPVSWSPTLFSGSGPFGLPPVPWTEKTIGRLSFFVGRGGHCCRGVLVGRTTFGFFWVAYKIKSNVLRSVLSIVGSMLNKSRVWSL